MSFLTAGWLGSFTKARPVTPVKHSMSLSLQNLSLLSGLWPHSTTLNSGEVDVTEHTGVCQPCRVGSGLIPPFLSLHATISTSVLGMGPWQVVWLQPSIPKLGSLSPCRIRSRSALHHILYFILLPSYCRFPMCRMAASSLEISQFSVSVNIRTFIAERMLAYSLLSSLPSQVVQLPWGGGGVAQCTG